MVEPSVSIVLPVANEEFLIQACLTHLLSLGAAEVVVVDGGSEDRTVEIIRREFPEVKLFLHGCAHRSGQLNVGGLSVESDVLLFVHADMVLPVDAVSLICGQVRKGAVGGGFRKRYLYPSDMKMHNSVSSTEAAAGVAFPSDSAGYPVEKASCQQPHLNHHNRAFSCHFGIPCRGVLFFYNFFLNFLCLFWRRFLVGTNGLFVQRSVFRELGGFPEQCFLEDLVFVQRLRKVGRLAFVRSFVGVSPRRYLVNGVFRQIFVNFVVLVRFWVFRVEADLLREKYYGG